MKLEDIIKALEGKEVDSGVIDAVKGLDQSAEVERLKSEIEASEGKSSGILADKKKYKERAESAESKLKEIEDSKLPEKERQEKALKEMQELLEAEKAERENDKAEFARVQRQAGLSDLTATIKWADGVPSETAKLIVSNAMKDIDLSDSAKVEEATKAILEKHKSFIAAAAPGGSGGKGGVDKNIVVDKDAPLTTADVVKQSWNRS